MNEIFKALSTQLNNCVINRDHFILPKFDNVNIYEQDIPTKGAELYHKCFTLSQNDEKIIINDISKDACRTFQINPDRNIVSLEHFNGETLISKEEFVWEDKI